MVEAARLRCLLQCDHGTYFAAKKGKIMKKRQNQVSDLWRSLWPLGIAALAAGLLSACAQLTPPTPAPVSTPTLTAPAGDSAGDSAGDTLARMQQFADGENNYSFYIPAT
jgi:hypothetical protein